MPGVKSLMMVQPTEEEGELPITMAMTRPKEEDSVRTKMLKEALRDVHDLHQRAQKTMPKAAKTASKAGAAIVNNRSRCREQLEKKRPPDVARLGAEGLEEYQSVTAVDELCAELAGAPDFCPVLKDCGKRINALCERLTAIQPPTPPDGVGGGRKTPPDDVRVVARPPDKAVDMVKSRVEKLALQYISDTVVFKPLEDLSETVEKANTYDQLRGVFPKRFVHHANLTFLTDHTLEDDAAFRRCVWQQVSNVSEQEKLAQARASRAGFQLGGGSRRRSMSGAGATGSKDTPQRRQPSVQGGMTRSQSSAASIGR